MDVSSINSDLIRGNVTTIILKALIGEDRYGYDILREIEVKSGGQYKLKQPTLYSCLKRLEKQGLISSYWGDESDTEGGRRRYYALTEAGRTYLDKMQSEYEYSRTILDSLLSENKFDFEGKEAPFDINSLRPYTKRSSDDDETVTADTSAQKPAVAAPTPLYMEEKSDADKSAAPISTPIYKAEKDAPVSETATTSPAENRADAYQSKYNTATPSSYDESYRHTSSSFRDMLGRIDDIINKKQDATALAEPVEDKATPQIEEIKEIEEEKLLEIKAEPIKQEPEQLSILFEDIAPSRTLTPEDAEVERIRKENAKRALYGGVNADILKQFDNPTKNETVETTKPDEEPIVAKDEPKSELSTREILFGNAKSNQTAPVIDKKTQAEREKSHELLFGNRDKAEPAPEIISPLSDSFLIFDKYNPKKPEAVKEEVNQPSLAPIIKEEPVAKTEPKKPSASAAAFSFRQDTDSVVNYRDAFASLRKSDRTATDESAPTDDVADIQQKPASSIDLKTRLFSEGYKLRAYSRENTENYYSLNFIKKNRINRDCYAIMYVLICLEVLVGWLIFKERFSPISYAAICIAAIVIPAVPFVIWSVNPDKRVRANYNFRTSILNRLMLYLNLLVLDCLIGFFGVGANINDGASMIAPILIPALLLLNLPLSAVVYLILYKTKKYHIS